MSNKTSTDLLVLTASNGENLKLAKRFVQIEKNLGGKSKLCDLTTIDLPLYNPRQTSQEGFDQAIQSLYSLMISSSRWIICAPEYNGSLPPVLSNAIAWLSVQDNDFRALFNGRPIAMASHSGGLGMELLISMRIQLTHLGAQVLGRQLASNNNKPASDDSIREILECLRQMTPLKI